MDHHRTSIVLAGVAVTASLLLPLTADASGPEPARDLVPEPRTRPCFIEPIQGYEALDGPVPLCPAPGFPV